MKHTMSASLVLGALLLGCSGGGGGGGGDAAVAPAELTFAGIGPRGIFDPSLTVDPATGRIWMSYSEVSDSAAFPTQNTAIETRLAFSDDAGARWTDAGIAINDALDLSLPQPPPNDAGTITHEVPKVVFDPGAPGAERWKVLWHRYLQVDGNRLFQHSWIALKTAPAPTGPWSAERKLFVGSLYDPVNDATIGPPEVQLDQLDAELNASLVFSEPGSLATSNALFVSLLAAEGGSTTGRIILVKLPHATGTWEYKGSLLVNAADGPLFGVDGFSASELYRKGADVFLIVTPQTNDFYAGTRVFRVVDLETATLARTAGKPDLVLQLDGSPGSFNGAAGYVAEATASGLLFSETIPVPPPFFRVFLSRVNP